MAKVRKEQNYAVIRLQDATNDVEPDMVPVNVNGDRIRIKRGEYVPVTAAVVSALRNAVRPVSKPVKGSSPDGMVRKRKESGFVQRFPFEMLGWVNQEEYMYLRSVARARSITEQELYQVMESGVPKAEAAA